jgi:hypothetical protein
MSNDWDVKRLIKEAQEAANKLVAYKSLKPHERTFVRAIVRITEQSGLTDKEIILGMKNVLLYLEGNLRRLRQTGKL